MPAWICARVAHYAFSFVRLTVARSDEPRTRSDLRVRASACCCTLGPVDRSDALRHLPLSYAAALRLKEIGADDSIVAATLDVDEAAVDNLLELARAKLAELLDHPERGLSTAGGGLPSAPHDS